MDQLPVDAPVLAFGGVSSIVLRFSEPERYEKAKALYDSALPEGQPMESAGPPSYSLIISKSSELLLMQKDAPRTDCTIVFWEVGTSVQDLEDACSALEAQGYKVIEKYDESPRGSRDKPETKRAVLKDKSGHRVGVIINPPVPFIKRQDDAAPPMPEFPIEPTHVINPPTVSEEGSSPAGS
ncbi:VOC family protein [Hymenobacter daeguensis]